MKKIDRKRIENFLLTNQDWRRAKIFFHQNFSVFLFRLIVVLTIFLLIAFLVLKLFLPKHLEKIYQKSSFYFFHYLNLDNHHFKEISVTGNSRVTKEEIIAIVEDVKSGSSGEGFKNYQPLIQNLILEIKQRLPWIDQITITRSMPNFLNIAITEYEPFAIWQDDGKKYITDKKGNLVPVEDLTEFEHLVILSGKDANIHASSLFNIFVTDPELSVNVYSATWTGGRRWDVRFENGLLIKLPETNISEAWQRLVKIYRMPGSIVGLKIIDLRIGDKIYLEYDDSVIKELKTL